MKKTLYVGLSAPKGSIHLPLIQTLPRNDCTFEDLEKASHIIVTSKTTCHYAKEHFQGCQKPFISVGASTTNALQQLGAKTILTAKDECQEGIIELIKDLDLKSPFFFWPHSNLSRPILKTYFETQNIRYSDCILYDTLYQPPREPIDFHSIDEIHFSSPSCVDAFFHFFGPPLQHITLRCKGRITENHLQIRLECFT